VAGCSSSRLLGWTVTVFQPFSAMNFIVQIRALSLFSVPVENQLKFEQLNKIIGFSLVEPIITGSTQWIKPSLHHPTPLPVQHSH
jgi:hypothetical protein